MGPEQQPTNPLESGVPQQAPEVAVEQPEVGRESEPAPTETPETQPVSEAAPAPLPTTPAPAPQTPVQPEKDALRMRVERTLEENLWKIYLGLPEGQRQRFKEGGEMCAETLRQLLDQKRVKPSQALNPITRWLKLIPNVLWAFLYQEAKIKTDRFMTLHKEHQDEIAGEIT